MEYNANIMYNHFMTEPNPSRKLSIVVEGQTYLRYPIKTSFILPQQDLNKVIEKYVLPIAVTGDIIVLGEKIVALSQNRVIYKKDLKVGFTAKFLAKFVKKTPHGFSVGNPLKMQTAINIAGLPRVVFASLIAGVGKLFGLKGLFYRAVGNQISQIDGFYGKFFPQYAELGILPAIKTNELCQNLSKTYDLAFAVADINDLGGTIVGISDSLKSKKNLLLQILSDNPAGQANEQTPIIIIRT